MRTILFCILISILSHVSFGQSKWDSKFTIHVQGKTLSELAKLEKLIKSDYDSVSVEIVKHAEPSKVWFNCDTTAIIGRQWSPFMPPYIDKGDSLTRYDYVW